MSGPTQEGLNQLRGEGWRELWHSDRDKGEKNRKKNHSVLLVSTMLRKCS
jgi:hypothetical protein